MDDDQWMAIDGYSGKQSTNGTWIYLNEDFEVYDGVSFKANQTIFSVKLIGPTAAPLIGGPLSSKTPGSLKSDY